MKTKNLQSESPNPKGLLDFFDIWAASRKSRKVGFGLFGHPPTVTQSMKRARSTDGAGQEVMRRMLILAYGSRHESR